MHMNETIQKGKKELKVLLSHVQLSGILPFKQTPCEGQFEEDKEKSEKLQASDLFSKFTADIIKEEVIFTR